jgi:periplasmic protein TonB
MSLSLTSFSRTLSSNAPRRKSMTGLEYAPAYTAPAGRRKRRISREATVAIGLSLLVHAGVGGYLATQKFTELRASYVDDHIVTTLERLPPPTVTRRTPPPPPVPVRPLDSDNPPPTQIEPLETVTTSHDPVRIDEPPVVIATEPTQPVQIAELRPPEPPRQRMIRNPSWVQRPSGRQLADLYPRIAAERGISGGATLMCEVIGSGAVRNCAVIDESPKGRGFGEAALASARLFKLNPRTVDGETVEGAKVRIPLVFSLAD